MTRFFVRGYANGKEWMEFFCLFLFTKKKMLS